MVYLQGPVACYAAPARQVGVCIFPVNSPVVNASLLRSDIWRCRGFPGLKAKVLSNYQPRLRKQMSACCTSASSSNGNGEDYVNSTVIEAVEVRSGADGFIIRMRDGTYLRCVSNSPQTGQLPDFAPHPVMVLRMDDGSDLLLPIIVLEAPCLMLLAALRDVQLARPTMYEVMKDMVENLGYAVKLARITKRLSEAYFAQVYLSKVGNETECLSFDLRPSDAINIAVRCQVPIQVNKNLAYGDGMRIIETVELSTQGPASDLLTVLDRPTGEPCIETREFDLLRNMLIAAVEERYSDAAQWRDKLIQFRAKMDWTLQTAFEED